MKMILGMIVRNEEEMLSRTLPAMATVPVDGRIAVDTGSTDNTVRLLKANGFTVGYRKWKSDFSAARNELLEVSRTLFPDAWILMLDGDECMFFGAIESLKAKCESTTFDLVTLPRFNLADHGNLWESGSFPDKQPRVLRLSAHLEFRNPVHEVVHYVGHSQNIPGEMKDDYAQLCAIYHYGLCKAPSNNWLRSHRYSQILKGEPEIDDAPEFSRITEDKFVSELKKRHKMVPFTDIHPLRGRI